MHSSNLYNFISPKRIKNEQNNSSEDNKTTPTSRRQSLTALKNEEKEYDNCQADRHDDRIRYINKYKIYTEYNDILNRNRIIASK